MHIPVKVDYGVRALTDLGLHGEEGPVRAADIARRTTIPEPYLVQVLHTLAKGGLVRSQRGPHGGHSLAMDPSDIRLSMVMVCLDSAEMVVGCLDDLGMCVHVPSCAQREVWRQVDQAVFNILDSTSVADLITRTRLMQAQRDRLSSRRAKPVIA